MKKLLFALLACGILPVLLQSCATAPRPAPTWSLTYYGFAGTFDSSLTKSDITITLEPLAQWRMYEPENEPLFSFRMEDYPEWKDNVFIQSQFSKPGPGGKYWIYPFNRLPAYRVTISNNTDHILRMKDSRIYLLPEGQDPVQALTLNGIMQYLNSFSEEVKNQWLSISPMAFSLSKEFPNNYLGQFVGRKLRDYKFIAEMQPEILPHFTYHGTLVFPLVSNVQSVKISFYDITTKTDAAGNPTEKTEFDFPMQAHEVQMWHDRVENKYKLGTPPQ